MTKSSFFERILVYEVMYMMGAKVMLTPKDILDKEFKIDARGFRITEVDAFLDIIIKDYVELFRYIKRLEDERGQMEQEMVALKSELRRTSDMLETLKGLDKSVTNVDVIKRLSNLEKYVYGENE